MKHIHTLPLFSQVISLFDLDLNHDKILRDMKKLKYREAPLTRGRIMVKDTYATDDYRILNSFPVLKKEIGKACYEHIQNVLNLEVDFFIYSSWATRTGPKGFTLAHTHPNSWLSGVYYPHSHPSFEIKLAHPFSSLCQPRIKEGRLNIYNSNSWTFPSLKGRLIIFPALVAHEILPYEAPYDRYSIAFNLVPKGPLGSHAESLNLSYKT